MDPLGAAVTAGGIGLSYVGGQQTAAANKEMAEKNLAFQREAAQNTISWRVADAQRAGIHPLYAIGAPSFSPSPVSVGEQGGGLSAAGRGLQGMGQDISRAALASQTMDERLATLAAGQGLRSNDLSNENAQLRNDLLRLQIAKLTAQTPPAIPLQDAPNNTFPVAETGKSSGMPPLMVSARRWLTDPGISSMKDFEDRYGDEGPVAALMPLLVLSNDLEKNYGPIQDWPAKMVLGGYEYLKADVLRELGNLRRMIGGR